MANKYPEYRFLNCFRILFGFFALFFVLFMALFIAMPALGHAGIACAKLDVAPAYAYMDVLEKGRTTKNLDMFGGRADLSVVMDWGLYLRFNVMSNAYDGLLHQAGAVCGFWLPLHNYIYIAPIAGINYSYFRTLVPIRQLSFICPKDELFRQQYRNRCPFIGFELLLDNYTGWRCGFTYNFAWCRSLVTITSIGLRKEKSESKGPLYALFIERDLNCSWTLSLGAGYNVALSHEKHGLRSCGAKLGLSYWFARSEPPPGICR